MAWIPLVGSGVEYTLGTDDLAIGTVAFVGNNLVGTNAGFSAGAGVCTLNFAQDALLRLTCLSYSEDNPDPTGVNGFLADVALWQYGTDGDGYPLGELNVASPFEDALLDDHYKVWPAGAGVSTWVSLSGNNPFELSVGEGGGEGGGALFVAGRYDSTAHAANWSFLIEVWVDGPPPASCFWTDFLNTEEDCDGGGEETAVLLSSVNENGYPGGGVALYVSNWCNNEALDMGSFAGSAVSIAAAYPYAGAAPDELCGTEIELDEADRIEPPYTPFEMNYGEGSSWYHANNSQMGDWPECAPGELYVFELSMEGYDEPFYMLGPNNPPG